MDLIWCFVNFKFLSANEKRTIPAKTHWTMEGTVELKQPISFMDVLVSKLKLGNVLHWRGELMLLFPKEKLWIPSKLIKIRLGGRNLLKILTTGIKKIAMKNYQADDVC